MSKSTITKSVLLPRNWKENEEQGLKKYLDDIFIVNESISTLFEDSNIEILEMLLMVSITIEDKVKEGNEIPLTPLELSTSEVLDIISGDAIDPTPLD